MITMLTCEPEVPLAPTALDPHTFHLFADGDDRFFYGVTSGHFMSLNAESYDLLERCRSNTWDEVDRQMAEGIAEWEGGDARRILRPLIDEGHFEYVPFDPEEQITLLDRLWRHKPRRLQLLLAQHCNLKCVYCYEEFNGSNARKRLMSMPMAKQAVDYLVHRSGGRKDLQITFFGGEPLLNKKVLKGVVDYCREIESRTDKRFDFELITNATLLDGEMLDYILANKFLLMISVDGYREMHTHNRPSVSGYDFYDRILENAKRADRAYKASGLGLPVKIRGNLTHEFHDLIKTVRFFEAEGFTTIGIASVDEIPWSEGNLHGCTDEDLDEINEQRKALEENGLRAMIAGKPASPYEVRLVRQMMKEINRSRFTRGLRCGVGRNTNIVDVEGNIYPCHRYGDMNKYIIGNVANMVLDEEKTRAYYEAVNEASSTKCSGCWGRNMCGGPCAWEVSHPNGTIIKPRDNHCQRVLSGFESILLYRMRLLEEAPHLIPEDQSCGVSCSC